MTHPKINYFNRDTYRNNLNNFITQFVTGVFINEKYIVVSNTNGIYSTIIHDVNEGRLLYYYPSESKIGYFINILDYLISIEEQSFILYMINDPLIKIQNIQTKKVSFKLGQNPVNLINLKLNVQSLIYIFQFIMNIKITLILKTIMINLMRFYRQSFMKEFIQILDNILVIQKSIQIGKNIKNQQNQIIKRSFLEIELTSTQSNADVTFDKIHSQFLNQERLYYLTDVAYMKQQLLYQYNKDNTFKEKYYSILQKYFSIELMECFVDDIRNCKHLHTQNIENSNRVDQFIFNIHYDYVYLGFTQYFGWDGYQNFENFKVQSSNVIIYRFKLNDKNIIVKQFNFPIFNIKSLRQVSQMIEYICFMFINSRLIYLLLKLLKSMKRWIFFKISHKRKLLRQFQFQYRILWILLYYFTIEEYYFNNEDSTMINYLNIINIEDGKFELIKQDYIQSSFLKQQIVFSLYSFNKSWSLYFRCS